MTNYTFDCLTSTACSSEQQEAAIYDLVGALCDYAGNISYDGKLTATERSYVVDKFGKISGSGADGARRYLAKGIERLWRDASRFITLPHHTCPSNEFTSESLQRNVNGLDYNITAVGGLHGCGSNYLSEILRHPALLEMAAHPDQWFIYYEGSAGKIPGIDHQENFLLDRLGKTLGIPVHDAVPIQPWDAVVLQEMQEMHNVDRMQVAMTYLSMMAAGVERARPGSVLESIDKGSAIFAEKFGVDRDQLVRECRKNLHSVAAAEASVRIINTINNQAVAIINRLCKKVFRERLAANPTRRNVLVIAGSTHRDIFR